MLVVKRRYIRDTPMCNPEGKQIGWYTKPADWYIARREKTEYGFNYSYEGLEKERGFRSKQEATVRRDELVAQGRF